MKSLKLDDMIKGWFVGPFEPTAFFTEACEVGVKRYRRGDKEPEHFHKIATEITVILSGRVIMCGSEWHEGEIVIVNPGVITSFEALEDCVTVVVKVPGVLRDKYSVSQ